MLKKKRKISVFVCGVDFQHELGYASDIVVYPSVESFKKNRTCWEQCGIVELEVTLKRWVEPQNFEPTFTEDMKYYSELASEHYE